MTCDDSGDSTALDDPTARRVAGRARTLHDRLTDTTTSAVDGTWTVGAEVVADWEAQFRTGREFERRLDALGLDRSTCVELVAHDRLSADATLPPWVDRLRAMLSGLTEPSRVERRTGPFTELAAAVAAYAADQLDDDDTAGLASGAVDRLQRWLRERIERWLWQPPLASFRENVSDDDDPSTVRPAFLSFLFDGGFARLCVEYPVYARLLVAHVDDWLATVRRVARRVRTDRNRLADTFGTGPLETVTAVEPLDDAETGNGGATLRVTFDDRLSVAYKPRPVDADATFYHTVDRVFGAVGWSARTPAVLDCGTHGWVEWIDAEPCADRAAVRRYYRRVGGLACIAYLLGSRDLTVTNVVAAGEHPVVIDAETAVAPAVEPRRRPTPTGVTGLCHRSVLSTLLIPYCTGHPYESADDTVVQTAGVLSVETTGRLNDTRPTFDRLGTGEVIVGRTRRSVSTAHAAPVVDGEPQSVEPYVSAVVEGFRRVHRAVVTDDTLVSPAEFDETTVRYVYRGNQDRLRDRLGRLDTLADGATYGRVVDELAVSLSGDRVAAPPWGIVDAERRAIERFRTPRFVAAGDEREVKTPDGDSVLTAAVSGVTAARRRTEETDAADSRRQIELIRGGVGQTPAPVGQPAADVDGAASEAEIRSAVARQATVLRTTAVADGHGGWTWGCLSPASSDGRLTVGTVDDSVAVGRAGVAAFFAAAGSVLDRDTTTAVRKTLALSVSETDGADNPADDEATARRVDCHDTLAVARIARALAVTADLIGDGEIREAAVELATTVDATEVDTVGESAGVADALATVADLTDTGGVRETAVECAAELETPRTATRRRLPPVPGSHGVGVVAERFGHSGEVPTPVAGPVIDRTNTDDRWTGNAARVARALAAGDPALARHRAEQLVSLRRRGEFRSAARTEAVPDPTFAYGGAGIGYTLCRTLSSDPPPRLLVL